MTTLSDLEAEATSPDWHLGYGDPAVDAVVSRKDILSLIAVARAAEAVCYTNPAEHRATDWGAYLASFGQRLFLLREAMDSLRLATLKGEPK